MEVSVIVRRTDIASVGKENVIEVPDFGKPVIGTCEPEQFVLLKPSIAHTKAPAGGFCNESVFWHALADPLSKTEGGLAITMLGDGFLVVVTNFETFEKLELEIANNDKQAKTNVNLIVFIKYRFS